MPTDPVDDDDQADQLDGDVDLVELPILDDDTYDSDDEDDDDLVADDVDPEPDDEDEDEDEESDDEPDDEDDDEDDDDDEEGEESLDVLLAREKVIDEDDIARISDEARGGLTIRAVPVGAGEFTCRSCFLVKRRAQLADEKKMYCFDCA